jgi:Ca2+-binding EF-hand superfamily protein
MSDWNALSAAVFAEFDADKDGTLSPAELQAFFNSLVAKGLASGDYNAWFAAVDKDGDGTVNQTEMAGFLESINYTA